MEIEDRWIEEEEEEEEEEAEEGEEQDASTQFLQTQKNQLNDLEDYLERLCNVRLVFGFNSAKNQFIWWRVICCLSLLLNERLNQ